ncbi:MAG: DedA family protein [Bacteroidales bacterium]|jgi:membrane protein YqaA with SNARE-associated domain|nr:DedA family protein [Bacteroidales bacterium]MDD3165928.1 DedA family protein [Bacteroidales bacterium]MDD4770083.1 DedA family protein [Bacteroidales bacterium]HKL93472.1 hypothetical protein [Bacteroidales bacterium]
MMDFLIDWGYWGLFLATFLAGSILPFSSELVLSGLLAVGADPNWCLIAATGGNFLGGMSCFGIGYLGKTEWMVRYLKIRPERIDRMKTFLQGKGALMAFFSFVPLVGDIIAVSLGFMRANIALTAFAMFVGKGLRYYLWLHLTYGFLHWI